MLKSETQFRVRYAETDQMGVVYYGNYAQYFEVGRVETIRQLGVSYKDMEKEGVIMPVVEMHIRYHKPAKYDDLITVKSEIRELPNSHKITFHQDVFNEENQLLCGGFVTLFFMDAVTMKRSKMPERLMSIMENHFK
jgi:acyl-CoA thioester hydrolase